MSKTDLLSAAFGRHRDLVEKSMHSILPDVKRSADILVSALKLGKKVLTCGNGGSAADSQHFAAELSGRYKKERRALPAISLSADTSALTAISNYYGYEKSFRRQVEALGKSGDVLVAITTSGSSKNVIGAISAAKKIKMKVILLTGEKGSSLKNSVDAAVVVPTQETARIQEIHELIYHAWCEYIDAQI